MGIKSLAFIASTLVLSTSVNAVVINTLNGVGYEWLELTATQGLSRDAVELRLVDVNDVLYGYQYASRQLVADLFLSYSSFDGISGYHGHPPVVAGVTQLLTDFGSTSTYAGNGLNVGFLVVDGPSVLIDGNSRSRGFYGAAGECNSAVSTCVTLLQTFYDKDFNPTATWQASKDGWYSASINVTEFSRSFADVTIGSYLVRETVVPVPAAIWLFGSGLIGLIGVARRAERV